MEENYFNNLIILLFNSKKREEYINSEILEILNKKYYKEKNEKIYKVTAKKFNVKEKLD